MQYFPGQEVYIFERHTSSKLARAVAPHWKGPFTVIKQQTACTYWVRKAENDKDKDVLVHVRHMKPLESRHELKE